MVERPPKRPFPPCLYSCQTEHPPHPAVRTPDSPASTWPPRSLAPRGYSQAERPAQPPCVASRTHKFSSWTVFPWAHSQLTLPVRQWRALLAWRRLRWRGLRRIYSTKTPVAPAGNSRMPGNQPGAASVDIFRDGSPITEIAPSMNEEQKTKGRSSDEIRAELSKKYKIPEVPAYQEISPDVVERAWQRVRRTTRRYRIMMMFSVTADCCSSCWISSRSSISVLFQKRKLHGYPPIWSS